MAKAPEQVEFHRDDFPTAGINSHEALDALIAPLNRRLAQDRTALAGGLTLANTGWELKTVQVQTPADDWVALTLAGAWVNAGISTPAVRKAGDGQVWMKGSPKSGSGTITTVPAGYVPPETMYFAISSDSAYAQIHVANTGVVTFDVGTAVNGAIINASWMAKDRTPVPLSCFPVPFTLSKVKNPEAVFLVGVRDITPAANGGGSDPALALGTAKTRMLDASTVQVQNVPGLLLGRRYELTFLALA